MRFFRKSLDAGTANLVEYIAASNRGFFPPHRGLFYTTLTGFLHHTDRAFFSPHRWGLSFTTPVGVYYVSERRLNGLVVREEDVIPLHLKCGEAKRRLLKQLSLAGREFAQSFYGPSCLKASLTRCQEIKVIKFSSVGGCLSRARNVVKVKAFDAC